MTTSVLFADTNLDMENTDKRLNTKFRQHNESGGKIKLMGKENIRVD